MERDKLIESVRREKKVYFLASKGGKLIGKDFPRLKRSQIDHSILRNELRARLDYPDTWRNEVQIKINGETAIIADAVFSRAGRIYFVEIDNRATMQSNISKIKKYAEIMRGLNRPAVLIWYTLYESRKSKLREACEKHNVNCEIY